MSQDNHRKDKYEGWVDFLPVIITLLGIAIGVFIGSLIF